METAQLIKQLRESTGYSLIDCKTALAQTNGSLEEAKKLLAKKYAAKYANIEEIEDVTERVIGIFRYKDNDFAYCEFSAKSDVVTRSQALMSLMETVFQVLPPNLTESESLHFCQNNTDFTEKLEDILQYYREPLKLLRVERKVLTEHEVLGTYLHSIYSKKDNLTVAKKAAMVVLNTSTPISIDAQKNIALLGDIIAMSIVGAGKNMVFYENEMNPQTIMDFKNEKIAEVKEMGKPEAVIEKIVAGQLQKFYEENTICHLPLISPERCTWLNVESEISIAESIEQSEKYFNTQISVSFYKTFNLN